jgi:inorganic pyrophosphatase
VPGSDDSLKVFIENTSGSSTKNTYDERTLEHLGSRQVASPYPYPYGFALNTLGGDGDCVDCFVVTDKALQSGDIVDYIPLHLLEQVEDGEVDHKVLGVLAGTPNIIDKHALETIRSFIMSVFSDVPGKQMQLGKLHGASEALRYIRECRV